MPLRVDHFGAWGSKGSQLDHWLAPPQPWYGDAGLFRWSFPQDRQVLGKLRKKANAAKHMWPVCPENTSLDLAQGDTRSADGDAVI